MCFVLSNIILKSEESVRLYKEQLKIVKKFLLIEVLRSLGGEEFMQFEKSLSKRLELPFEEKDVEGETSFDYWMRTLRVVLETDGTPEEILKRDDKTYPAYRWAMVVYTARLGFWDAPDKGDEFLITDAGMTSENELGWDGFSVQNYKKLYCVASWLMREICGGIFKEDLIKLFQATVYFHENFQMFPISPKRMIVLISPFYNMWSVLKKFGCMVPPLTELTRLPNESLFVAMPRTQGEISGDAYNNNEYIYPVQKLSRKEIRYCNCLFLDRIHADLGFSSLENAAGSIFTYCNAPHAPRVDYTELYNIIQDRIPGKFEMINRN